MAAHDILLEDLRRLSEGINQAIDLTGMDPTIDRTKFANSSPLVHLDVLTDRFSQQLSTSSEGSAESLSWDDLLNSYQSLGNQLLQLWNTFLKFHRENKTMILEFLRHSWAIDRRSEWSIWMVHSISEMPHQSLSSRVEGTIMRWGTHGRSLNSRKLTDDPSQTATMRAELHRRGIAQMKINNRFTSRHVYIRGSFAHSYYYYRTDGKYGSFSKLGLSIHLSPQHDDPCMVEIKWKEAPKLDFIIRARGKGESRRFMGEKMERVVE
ncbi:uncharacterized protein LOC114712851, partial [Neltuma alba]|uniref:uncharacterized protein LOC114712851 n=1 Tax=Neltuma alba TaxID=207710 RepID=UPI0010A3F7E7